MSNLIANLFNGASSKFWAAVLGSVAEVVATGHADWKTVLAAAASAAVVYLVPNRNSSSVTPPAS